MNIPNRRLWYFVSLSVTIFLVSLVALWGRGAKPSPVNETEPQCGHWAVLRCCELLGVPTDMPAVIELLPTSKHGHSLLQLATAFETMGFATEGRIETAETMPSGKFPCVAHIEHPDHFVVVTGMEGDRVHFFDRAGKRKTNAFDAMWTNGAGKVLWVRRPDIGVLPAWMHPSESKDPCIQFDALLIDHGNIPANDEPVEFVFPFRNVGKADLWIREVNADCQCIETQKPAEPIPPGGIDSIRLLYHVTGRTGSFGHTAIVSTNDPAFPLLRLQAWGNTDWGVKVSPPRINLGELVQGQEYSTLCRVMCSGDSDALEVQNVTTTIVGADVESFASEDTARVRRWLRGQDVSLRDTISRSQLVGFSFVPPFTSSGRVDGTVDIQTSVKDFERISVPVTGFVVPPVAACPGIVDFGELAAGEKSERSVSLVSRTGERFRLVAIEPENQGIESLFSNLDSGDGVLVRFRACASEASSLHYSTVRLEIELTATAQTFSLRLPIRIWRRTR